MIGLISAVNCCGDSVEAHGASGALWHARVVLRNYWSLLHFGVATTIIIGVSIFLHEILDFHEISLNLLNDLFLLIVLLEFGWEVLQIQLHLICVHSCGLLIGELIHRCHHRLLSSAYIVTSLESTAHAWHVEALARHLLVIRIAPYKFLW